MISLFMTIPMGETIAQSPDGALNSPFGAANPNLLPSPGSPDAAGEFPYPSPLPGEPMSSPFMNFIQYENSNLGVRFIVPENSVVTEENADGVNILASDSYSNPLFAISVVTTPASSMSIEEVNAETINGSPDPDFGSIVSSFDTSLSNIPASLFNWYSPQTQVYTVMILTVHDDIVYNLIFYTSAVDYQNLFNLFGQIQYSFQIF